MTESSASILDRPAPATAADKAAGAGGRTELSSGGQAGNRRGGIRPPGSKPRSRRKVAERSAALKPADADGAAADRQPSGLVPAVMHRRARREALLRHRPSKPLRHSLSPDEVLEQQRQLMRLREEQPQLFRVDAGAVVAPTTAATTPVAAEAQQAEARAGVQDEPVVAGRLAAALPWQRVAVLSGVLAVLAGGAYLYGQSNVLPLDSSADSPAAQASAEGRAGAPAAAPEVLRWKDAARRSSDRAEELSEELVTVRQENASLTRSVDLLEAETLNLQTELLERELEVVSLSAELEGMTEKRVIYNITNVPLDGAPAPVAAGVNEPTPPAAEPPPDSYSTVGQAANSAANIPN